MKDFINELIKQRQLRLYKYNIFSPELFNFNECKEGLNKTYNKKKYLFTGFNNDNFPDEGNN